MGEKLRKGDKLKQSQLTTQKAYVEDVSAEIALISEVQDETVELRPTPYLHESRPNHEEFKPAREEFKPADEEPKMTLKDLKPINEMFQQPYQELKPSPNGFLPSRREELRPNEFRP